MRLFTVLKSLGEHRLAKSYRDPPPPLRDDDAATIISIDGDNLSVLSNTAVINAFGSFVPRSNSHTAHAKRLRPDNVTFSLNDNTPFWASEYDTDGNIVFPNHPSNAGEMGLRRLKSSPQKEDVEDKRKGKMKKGEKRKDKKGMRKIITRTSYGSIRSGWIEIDEYDDLLNFGPLDTLKHREPQVRKVSSQSRTSNPPTTSKLQGE